MQKSKLKTFQKYVTFFYIYAFLGWIVDVSICLVSDGVLQNRGFLYETICPMYGYAALVLIFFSEKIRGRNVLIKKLVVATVWCTVLEYITAFILESFFGLRWWDYSNEPFNFQGRVCLAASLFWGILSILFMLVIHPTVVKGLKKVTSKMSEKVQSGIVYSALLVTSVDTVISIVNNLAK